MWRGDLSPMGCEATPLLKEQGLLRSPSGINPLATKAHIHIGFGGVG
ncbi:hypothetical protein PMI37_01058 [Pseudomonas sp. GM80]|nr:hypothetical protein PMI37_01058 [Pseudomonas sp. GM80]